MKNKKIFYTEHQLKSMAKRGISKTIVETVINKGVWESGKNAFSHQIEYRGIVVVLYEQKTQYNVVTCMTNRDNTKKAEELKERLNISFWKAVHMIVKEINFED